MGDALPAIAVLDDEAEYRKALARLLKAYGFEVEVFADGGELLSRCARRVFGCVLLDLNMPGMSGFDVLAELHGELRPPPVIILTANDDPAMMKRALALNAFDYQLKPIAAPALLGAIDRALGR
jgi:FixJ family two-component response regulator